MMIKRISKYALHFYFDLDDAQNFITLLNQERFGIEIKYLKNPQIQQRKLLSWVMDEDERIVIQNNNADRCRYATVYVVFIQRVYDHRRFSCQ